VPAYRRNILTAAGHEYSIAKPKNDMALLILVEIYVYSLVKVIVLSTDFHGSSFPFMKKTTHILSILTRSIVTPQKILLTF
jgi:hypothetical protein